MLRQHVTREVCVLRIISEGQKTFCLSHHIFTEVGYRSMGEKAAFHTLGCRVNAYETEAMAELLKNAGYEIVPFKPGADIYIINTCTVTGIADRKSRQMLHRAKEMNPAAVVAAVGCYAENSADSLAKDPDVDLIIGNASKSRLPEIISGYRRGRDFHFENVPVSRVKTYDLLSISDTAERTRAYIKIQDGCNQFCTYCMIPYVRGRVRSRSREEIRREAERLAEAGFCEIVLTGIHISSYGLDFDYPGENRQTPDAADAVTNHRLLLMIRDLAEIQGIARIRLGSLEPGIMTEEFVRGLSEVKKLCPSFHLSLQSGCDATLLRMGRKYRTSEYRGICALLRQYFENPAISTDIIAGFPGETDDEALETLHFAEEIGFSKIHVFKYSGRKGTRAADMPGQVPEEKKKARSEALIRLDTEMHRAYAEGFLGQKLMVLIEEPSAKSGFCAAEISRMEQREEMSGRAGFYTGHTKEGLVVHAECEADPEGRILPILAETLDENGDIEGRQVL